MIRKLVVLIANVLVALALPGPGSGPRADENQPAAKLAPPLAQWRALRYGMFIHFGISTFTGRDIDPGDRPSATYAPTDLDVDQWIRVARDAGMQYAVLTAKHVPGHCLWDSKVFWQGKEFDYDVATSGDPTDVVEKFVAACKKYGLKPGLYYCLMDGRHGLGHGTWNAAQLPGPYYQLVKDHLAELLHRYRGVFYLWLDIPRVASGRQRAELYRHIKQIRPGCIVLFNHGTVRPTGPITIADFQAAWPTDVLNTECTPIRPGWFQPVQTWRGKTYQLGYEHCDTITPSTWHWIPNNPPRPAAELYELLKQVTAAGGNLLLNVAPDRSGRIPDNYVQALLTVKRLLDQTGYETPSSLGSP